ncbi:MAG: recombination regulator RecX [Burkholderiales bacterium]
MSGKSLRALALGLLARREHTRAQLASRLAPLAGEGEDLEALLDEFVASGFLSDERFAEQFVRRRRGRQGPLRIGQELRARGVDEAGVGAALRDARASEAREALALLRRKYPVPPASADERARQGRFLQNRGFSLAAIRRVLDLPADEDTG